MDIDTYFYCHIFCDYTFLLYSIRGKAMYIYFFNALLILLWFLVSKLAKNPKKIFCVMVTLQLVVFLGLRDYASINIDMFRYYNHYENLGRLSLVDSIFYSDSSQLYYLLCWLFSNRELLLLFFCV